MSQSGHNRAPWAMPGDPAAHRKLWLWLAVSLLAHLNVLALIAAAAGAPRAPGLERLRLAFSPPDQEEPPPAQERRRLFTDLPDEMRDEGEPPSDAERVGMARLLAQDPESEPRSPDTPLVEEGTEAPVFQPGPPPAPEGYPEPPGVPLPEPEETPFDEEPPHEEPPAEEPPPDPDPQPPTEEEEAPPPGPPETEPDEEGPPPGDETEPAPSEDEAPPDKPDTPDADAQRPRLVARPPGEQYLFAFPREGYIQETPHDGVERTGTAQYNVRWDEYAPYYRHLFRRIEAVFRVRRLRYRRLFTSEGATRISIVFRVLPDGRFEDLSILEDGEHPLLASDLAAGVRSASPVDPFPDYVEEEALHIRLNCFFE